jgi:intracellular septation protein A
MSFTVKAMTLKMSRIVRFASWTCETFGSMAVFYACLHFFGLVAAIVSGIITGVAFVIRGIVRDRRVSPFTAFIAVNVAVFGFLDLHYRTGFFVKIEPAFGNAATGLFFLGSVLVGRPIITEFAERASGRKLTRAYGYFRVWTCIWGLFFFLRAAGHVWLAYYVALEKAVILRSVLGPLSFVALFAVEIPIRYLVYGQRGFQKKQPSEALHPLGGPSATRPPSQSVTRPAVSPVLIGASSVTSVRTCSAASEAEIFGASDTP